MNKPAALLIVVTIALSVLGCRRRIKQPLTPDPPDWMAQELAKQAQASAPEASEHGPVLKAVAHREDQYTKWPMQLESGKCYLFSGIGDESVEEIYLELNNPEDDRVARWHEDKDRGVMEHCAQVSGTFELMAKVTEGHGHYLVGVYVKSGDGAAPAATTEPTAAAGSSLTKLIDELASSKAPKADRIGDAHTGEADTSDWYVALMEGKCYTFIGLGDDGVKKLGLGIWDPDDKQLANEKSQDSQVVVELCPKSSGMHRLHAEVGDGSGKYEVGVFVKAD